MAGRIEDYGVIGNCETTALVGRDGSIDWLGVPRFDSAACFAALLGDPEQGRWLIAPASEPGRVTRAYRGHTMVLETTFEVDGGAVSVVDCMAWREGGGPNWSESFTACEVASRCTPNSSCASAMARLCHGSDA